VLGLVLRLVAAVMLPDQTAKLPDAQEYRNAASQLLHGGFIVYHYFMPLYRALIALTDRAGANSLPTFCCPLRSFGSCMN
jgi:thiazole synthase ThiGH ThiG subunit